MRWYPRQDPDIPSDEFIQAIRDGEIPHSMSADALVTARARIFREQDSCDADWKSDQAERALLAIRSLDYALMTGSFAAGNWWVYLLITDPDVIVYVGISSNLLGRLGQHSTARRGMFDRVALLECPDEQAARRTESALILMLQPTLNIHGKPKVA